VLMGNPSECKQWIAVGLWQRLPKPQQSNEILGAPKETSRCDLLVYGLCLDPMRPYAQIG